MAAAARASSPSTITAISKTKTGPCSPIARPEAEDVLAVVVAPRHRLGVRHLDQIRVALLIGLREALVEVMAVMARSRRVAGVEGTAPTRDHASLLVVVAEAVRHVDAAEEVDGVLIASKALGPEGRDPESALHLPIVAAPDDVAHPAGVLACGLLPRVLGDHPQEHEEDAAAVPRHVVDDV